MRASRGLSSILDVSLCLLLITASAITMSNAPDPSRERPSKPDADATLEVVATMTAWIEYSSSGGPRPQTGQDLRTTQTNRTAHGTLAGLLAAATVSNASIHGRRVKSVSPMFQRTVVSRTRRTIRKLGERVQLIVTWRPYPGSHVRGTIRVGPSPPRFADVQAARMIVPLGTFNTRERAVEAGRRGGFENVAGIVATDLNLLYSTPFNSQSPRSKRPFGHVESQDVETELRSRFDSPVEAARAVQIGQVRLTVRTWSA